MPDYRRAYVAGGTYFFTVVTHLRRPILCTPLGRRCLRDAVESVRVKLPFTVVAIVLLPEHLHAVWLLPPGDDAYSLRWKRIKELFTRSYLDGGGKEGQVSRSRRRHGECGVWQRRYWEHVVRDNADLKACIDYVHWNPKKHGHAANVRDWPWSSFQRFVEAGEYTSSWGASDPVPNFDEPEWGE